MKIVLCTGVMRSGSTWSYNVSRVMLGSQAHRRGWHFIADYADAYHLEVFLRRNMARPRSAAVIKSHSPSRFAMDRIGAGSIWNICTIRDPRDCVASRRLFESESFDTSVRHIVANLRCVDQYRHLGNTLFIRYEEMIAAPRRRIHEIAQFLQIPFSDMDIARIDARTGREWARRAGNGIGAPGRETIRVGTHRVDRLTQLHENHLRGGIPGRWRTELTADQRAVVNRRLYDWIFSLGYEIDEA